jgi:hypothetical protein
MDERIDFIRKIPGTQTFFLPFADSATPTLRTVIDSCGQTICGYNNSSTVYSGILNVPPTIVSLLPVSSLHSGGRAMVLDSSVAASGNFAILIQGSGSNTVPVYSDGSTAWRVG